MRQMLRESIEGARDMMVDTVKHLRGGGLSDEEALRRYQAEHQGRPDALLAFASQNATGDDVLIEAVRYEQEMERRLQQGGV